MDIISSSEAVGDLASNLSKDTMGISGEKEQTLYNKFSRRDITKPFKEYNSKLKENKSGTPKKPRVSIRHC